MSPRGSRRSFITSLAASVGGVSLTPLTDVLAATAQGRRWDLAWLDSLKGKHRQVFDCQNLAGFPLNVVGNYLRAHKEVYNLAPKDLTTVVGIAMRCFPINASDELYRKYPIGRLWDVKDPRTGEHAVRNIYADVTDADSRVMPALPVEDAVPALVAGGTVFWQCYNGLRGAAMRIANDMKADPAATLALLERGLLPHVKLIPAHTMVLGLAQERGCAYEML